MDGVWAQIGAAIWKHLEPWLNKKWEEVKPKIIEFIKAEFQKWMPQIIKAALVGAVKGGGRVVVNAEDKMTDLFPGKLDDAVLDPIVDGLVNDFTRPITDFISGFGRN
jgi:D-aminopeptidase